MAFKMLYFMHATGWPILLSIGKGTLSWLSLSLYFFSSTCTLRYLSASVCSMKLKLTCQWLQSHSTQFWKNGWIFVEVYVRVFECMCCRRRRLLHSVSIFNTIVRARAHTYTRWRKHAECGCHRCLRCLRPMSTPTAPNSHHFHNIYMAL